MAWDVDEPTGSGDMSARDDAIRANFAAIETILGATLLETPAAILDTSTGHDHDGTDSKAIKAIKGWVNFNGTGTPTITGSYNVSGTITDNGTGDYTITWDTDFADAYYAVSAIAAYTGSKTAIVSILAQAAGSLRILCHDDAGSVVDPAIVCVIATA